MSYYDEKPIEYEPSLQMAKDRTTDPRLRAAVESIPGMAAPSPLNIPPAVTFKPVESWSIVVAGYVDPRQHFPPWYQQINCLSDEEMAAAMAGQLIVTPNFSTFNAGPFSIVAQQERWQINTTKPEYRDRIISVCNAVWQKLYEVPIQAFGINCRLHVKTKVPDVRAILLKMVLSTGLPFPQNEGAEARISWTGTTSDFTTSAHLGSIEIAPDHLVLGHDRHHPIPKQDKPQYFDLPPLINRFAMKAWEDARDFLNSAAKEVNRSLEVRNA